MNEYKQVIGEIELPLLARVLSMNAGIIALRLRHAGVEEDMIDVMFDRYLTPTAFEIAVGMGFTKEQFAAEAAKLTDILLSIDAGGDK